MKFTNSKRFLNGPAVSSNHTSYLSINLHNPKFYLRNFYRCFTQKVYILMSNHSLLSGSPVFTCAVLELGQATCPQSHCSRLCKLWRSLFYRVSFCDYDVSQGLSCNLRGYLIFQFPTRTHSP